MVTLALRKNFCELSRDEAENTHNTMCDNSMDESIDPLEESGGTVSDEENTEPKDDAVAEDMERFTQSFKNISQRYRLINRIGEGTFSTVYKAEDLLYDHYQNDWDVHEGRGHTNDTTSSKAYASQSHGKPRLVAIKKIYVTSSPLRILNELELLYDLRNSKNVCPLITAFRHQDQVIAVLPFFQHKDFRDYFRDFSIPEMRVYFHSLFTALHSVHEAEIIHRDIKPTNFLYAPNQRRGVLVDFGLAEREGTDYHRCLCEAEDDERARRVNTSAYEAVLEAAEVLNELPPRLTYPNNDQRPSRRANRAGTRGFRAPEVLLKCTAQTCNIDVWSCGVILLTFLSKRFPFFHSADDIDAFVELAHIYGRKSMKETALLHGQIMHCNIPTVTERGHRWEKIILWCTNRSKKQEDGSGGLSLDERLAIDFMRYCLELDPGKRMTAADALKHPWITGASEALESETRKSTV